MEHDADDLKSRNNADFMKKRSPKKRPASPSQGKALQIQVENEESAWWQEGETQYIDQADERVMLLICINYKFQ